MGGRTRRRRLPDGPDSVARGCFLGSPFGSSRDDVFFPFGGFDGFGNLVFGNFAFVPAVVAIPGVSVVQVDRQVGPRAPVPRGGVGGGGAVRGSVTVRDGRRLGPANPRFLPPTPASSRLSLTPSLDITAGPRRVVYQHVAG